MPDRAAVGHVTALAYVAATAATVLGAVTHRPALQYVVKPAMMPILALRARAHDDPTLAIGLAAATVGDVAMIEPDDDRRVRLGASCFAVMQSAWSTRLWRTGSRVRPLVAATRAAGWAGGVAIARRRAPGMLPVTATYGGLVATTAVLGADGTRGAAVGSTLFLISDALVLARRAGSPRWADALEAAVLVTYAAAQWLLVRGMSDPVRTTGRRSRGPGGTASARDPRRSR
ncbi:lysoplasmalogenase [Rhodococcoides corynebacterioides]|uniref:Lysoplasmalogenase n=1 Tax=Rhodococcoides corynebacterioides TaxID=53972 RepID=A0ABS7P876_9NOCA|nr:lysoplasmalogenase [Rhodococcus corynebacterioides]MBY6368625.1 lysoplasmalogenase [Rhodococcus corynebacterioides]MBY6409558.1 lysoplasmalogenase [Rhodococcus corynebacterioides]